MRLSIIDSKIQQGLGRRYEPSALMSVCAGYGIVTQPTFSVSRVAYILAYGGVYAVAGIRLVSSTTQYLHGIARYWHPIRDAAEDQA